LVKRFQPNITERRELIGLIQTDIPELHEELAVISKCNLISKIHKSVFLSHSPKSAFLGIDI